MFNFISNFGKHKFLFLKKSKLLAILSAFSPNEIREFDDFVQSPFFNKNRGITRLFGYLKQCYPAFEDNAVSKRIVFAKVFPEIPYNDGFLRTLMFTLVTLAEDYLSLKEIRSRTAYHKVNLLKAYNRKNLWKQFEKECRRSIKTMDEQEKRDFLYYYERYSMENEAYHLLQKKYFNRTEKFHLNSGIYNITYNLGSYFYLTMLRLYLYILNVRELFNIDLKAHDTEEVFKTLKPENYKDTPVIGLFYDIIRMHLEQNSEKYFHAVSKGLQKNMHRLINDDIIEIVINLENYCKKMIRLEKAGYRAELLKLYKLEIEKEIYRSEPGGLSLNMFISVVKSGLGENDNEWVNRFISRYKKELPAEIREAAGNIAAALVDFAEGRFERSASLLTGTKHIDVYNKFEIKSLLLSCYYELGMYDEMEASIDSFRHMLANDKLISHSRKKYYLNFIRVLLKLIKLKERNDTAMIPDIRAMIKTPDFILEKQWVEKKLAEAENRKN